MIRWDRAMMLYRGGLSLALLVAMAGIMAAAGLGGCGSDGSEQRESTTTVGPGTDTTGDESAPTSISATTSAGPLGSDGGEPTSAGVGSSGPTTTSDADLPGDPIELGFLQPGNVVGVVGVAHDDVLKVRAGPGTAQAVVGELAPLEDRVILRGSQRHLPGSVWVEIDHDGESGWVSLRYLAFLGPVRDITADVIGRNGGQAPTANSMEALLLLIAGIPDCDDGQECPRVVTTAAPTANAPGEGTYDLVGFPDDAVYGGRLHISATRDPAGVFTLNAVEAIDLCGRAVDATGVCV